MITTFLNYVGQNCCKLLTLHVKGDRRERESRVLKFLVGCRDESAENRGIPIMAAEKRGSTSSHLMMPPKIQNATSGRAVHGCRMQLGTLRSEMAGHSLPLSLSLSLSLSLFKCSDIHRIRSTL